MTAMPPLHIGEVDASFTKPISCAILRIKKSSLYTREAEITYSAYDLPLSKPGSLANTLGTLNPYRYRGYIYDEETGLYYCNSRYYDPSVGRFLNADTEEVVLTSLNSACWNKNLYAYCDNNPIVRVDTSGQYWHIIADAAIGGTIALITSICDGGSFLDCFVAFLAGNVTGGLMACGGYAAFAGCAFSGAYSAFTYCRDTNEEDISLNKALDYATISMALSVGSFGLANAYTANIGNAIDPQNLFKTFLGTQVDVGVAIAEGVLTKLYTDFGWNLPIQIFQPPKITYAPFLPYGGFGHRSTSAYTTTYMFTSPRWPNIGIFGYVGSSAYTSRM